METAASNRKAAESWRVSEGVPLATEEIARAILRAAERPRENAENVVCSASVAVIPLDEAENLTYAHRDAPKWYRRIMRKQGRIDRLVRAAALNLFLFLNSLPKATGKVVLNDAKAELDAVESLMHSERGPSLLRRLRRPQSEINEHLSRAVAILVRWVIAPERGFVPSGEDGAKLTGMLRWHAKEAEYLSLRRKHRKPIVRRYMCDQYQLNRCLIIAIRKTAELFIKG
jgi:hypothetical protein